MWDRSEGHLFRELSCEVMNEVHLFIWSNCSFKNPYNVLMCHTVVSVNTEQHIHKVCMNVVDRSGQIHSHTHTLTHTHTHTHTPNASSGEELSPYQSMITELEKKLPVIVSK